MSITVSAVDTVGIYDAMGWADGSTSRLNITASPGGSWKTVTIILYRSLSGVGSSETIYSRTYSTSRSTDVVLSSIALNASDYDYVEIRAWFGDDFGFLGINIYPYAAPSIDSFTAQRASAEGAPENAGTNLLYSLAGAITTQSPNAATVRLKYRVKGASTWTSVDLATGASSISYADELLAAVVFAAGTTYEVAAEIEDLLTLATATRELTKATGLGLMFFSLDGQTVGVGSENTEANTWKFSIPMLIDALVLERTVTSLRVPAYDSTLAAAVTAGGDIFSYDIASGEGADGAMYAFELSLITSAATGADCNMHLWVNGDTTLEDYKRAHYRNGSDYSTLMIIGYSDGSSYGPAIIVGTIRVFAGMIIIEGRNRRTDTGLQVAHFLHTLEAAELTKIQVRAAASIAAGSKMKIRRLV